MEEQEVNCDLENVKPFKMMLMNSKFNKPGVNEQSASHLQLIATGGHSGVVTVWNADTKSTAKQDIA